MSRRKYSIKIDNADHQAIVEEAAWALMLDGTPCVSEGTYDALSPESQAIVDQYCRSSVSDTGYTSMVVESPYLVWE